MLIGVLVSFHTVVGDSSGMFAQLLGIAPSQHWRVIVQLAFLLIIELPFSLLRNISSLNILSMVSLIVYSTFTLFMFAYGKSNQVTQVPTSYLWVYSVSVGVSAVCLFL